MSVNIAVLKETQPHERRAALALLYEPNTDMVFGDAQTVLITMIEGVPGLGAAAA